MEALHTFHSLLAAAAAAVSEIAPTLTQ
jgi:hypothetical protein